MNYRFVNKLIGIFLAFAVVIVLSGTGLAQGKSKGNSGGKGNSGNVSKGNSSKTTSDDSLWDNPQDDKGKGKGQGQSKNGKSNKPDDKGNKGGGSQRFNGLSKKLGVPADTLQSRYENERRFNPDLTYGQFVAANMIAKNDKKGVSAGDILGGLRNGQSIGQTLKNKGWDNDSIDRERKRIKKDRDKDKDRDYNDRDVDWIF